MLLLGPVKDPPGQSDPGVSFGQEGVARRAENGCVYAGGTAPRPNDVEATAWTFGYGVLHDVSRVLLVPQVRGKDRPTLPCLCLRGDSGSKNLDQTETRLHKR